MLIEHQAQSRGLADHGWLKSRHTFSFADYYNPDRMGFGALRVINDDSVAPGRGFGTHSHRDMEIISIPLSGALQHKDSMGNASIIKKGEVQIMSAGTGVAHSEFNASATEEVKFLQIWVLPHKLGIQPRYEQKLFSHEERKNKLAFVVSPDGRHGSLTINQNAFFSLCDLEQSSTVTYNVQSVGNGIYVFLLSGQIEIEGKILNSKDGAGIRELDTVEILAKAQSELLIMEVPL